MTAVAAPVRVPGGSIAQNDGTPTYVGPGWTLVEHLAAVDQDLLSLARTPDGTAWALTPEGAEARRLLTLDDPLLFAWIYLRKHVRDRETGVVSFSPFHLACFADARQWLVPTSAPAEDRTAYVAPRNAGKSTLWFLLIPLWAAAHDVVDFIAAFAHSGPQAELHLQSFKMELDRNPLLRHDFPLLCRPATRPAGVTMQDNRSMMIAASGFVFAAKGIDSGTLGMKVGERRPRVLLFDDVEPDESNYSPGQKEKRLTTIRDAAFPLNVYARVVMVGTTTMRGSVMHDIVRQVTDPENAPEWPAELHIRTRYFPAILTADDGSETSLWPEKWPLDYLLAIRHTRDYQKNYLNLPADGDGGYWTQDDIRYGTLPAITRRILSIDPAATSKRTSDPTGLAVVAHDPTAAACVVEFAQEVRLAPAQLREKVLTILAAHDIRHVLIEDNNGGEWLAEVLAPLPAKVHTVHQDVKKEVRAAKVLDLYQAHRVLHARKLSALEEQQLAFPKVAHDDLVDAAGSGVWLFLKDTKRPAPRATTRSYA